MPRLSHVDIRDYTSRDGDGAWGQAVGRLAEAYAGAFAASPLRGPATWVSVALRPSDSSATTVTVLVHCDKPHDGMELITADLPQSAVDTSTDEGAALIGAILDAGFTRLGTARAWDPHEVAKVLQNAHAAAGVMADGAVSPHEVLAFGRGVSAPEQPHEILVCGGGPTNGVPKAYLDELTRLLGQVASDDWARWWADSPVKLAEVFYWFDAARPGVRVRVGAKVTAAIDRPVKTVTGTNPIDLARHDVDALVTRLMARLQLSNHPELK